MAWFPGVPPPRQVLKTLDSTWTTMEFEHEPHPRTGTVMLKADEALVETLEDNQVQLQNLMMSKYLSHFLKEVTSWQQKLSTADSVISIWFEVQRTWSHLESIFIGSEDIRKQLPEDSRRFDDIDLEFKVCPRLPRWRAGRWVGVPLASPGSTPHPGVLAARSPPQALMADAVKTPNVVEATNKPGLYDKLEVLKKRWVPRPSVCARWPEAVTHGPQGPSPRPAGSECRVQAPAPLTTPASGKSTSREAAVTGPLGPCPPGGAPGGGRAATPVWSSLGC